MSSLSFNQKLSYVELAIMILFSARAIVPDFSLIPDLIGYGLTIGYLAFVAIHSSSTDYPNNIGRYILIALFLAVLYSVLTDTQTIQQDVSNRSLKVLFAKFNQYSYQVVPFAIMFRLISKGSSKQQRIFLICTAIFFGITLIATNTFLSANPGAIRSFHNRDFDSTELEGLGNFYFVYGTAALIPSLCLIYWYSRNMKAKITSVIVIVYIFSFLLKAQFSLALLIPLICLLYIYYIKASRVQRRIFWLFTPIAFVALPFFFKFVANHVGNDNDIHDRFMELYYAFTFQDSTSTAQDGAYRLTTYWDTIKAFFVSPIWGTKINFDPHSTFLGMLADVGLLGFVPYMMMFYGMTKKIYRYLDIEGNKSLFKPSLLFIIMMGLTNPIHSTSALQFVIWCIAPLIVLELKKLNKSI